MSGIPCNHNGFTGMHAFPQTEHEKKLFFPMFISAYPLLNEKKTFPVGSVRILFCERYFYHCRRISRVLRHRGGCNDTALPAAGTGRLPGQLVMVAGGFVDDMVFSIALRAGKPDNVPGSCACDFRFYGRSFH
jgi:hypothetical protein